jgi:hypothetical protein
MWAEWKSTFLTIADKHAPIRTKRIRSKNSPWITSDLKKRMHDRDIAKIKAIHSTVPGDWDNFRRLRNIVNKEIKLAKESYYRNAFMQHSGNSRKTCWQIVNDLTSRKSKSVCRELNLNGNSISNPSDLSNAFNEHFSTIGPKLASDISVSSSHTSYTDYLINTDKRFQFTQTNNDQVFSVLSKLCK